MKILHNPRCRKSRETLTLIEEAGKQVEIIEYLKNTPSRDELVDILNKLSVPAEKIVRKSEVIFKENFKGKTLSNDEWIDALIEFPKLIERPIVIEGNKAIIGRPPENVVSLF